MKKTKNLIWIASYPKSGNTWMRTLLTSLIYTNDGIFNFDLLPKIDQFEKKSNFSFLKKLRSSDFDNLDKMAVVSKYWHEAQENLNYSDLIFLKTHSSNYNYKNLQYANLNKTRGCIYLVRDPRDVAISYSKFMGCSIDETIDYMLGPARQIWNQEKTVGIIISRWDYHIASWINLDTPKIFIRYEDLLHNTKKVLNELIRFIQESLKIKIELNDNKIDNIIKTTSFELLKNKENTEGFKEASKNSPFFREGKSLQWKKTLTHDQIEKIESNLGQYMKKFNYIK
ncbi:sulfotransferase domain-containing protein [Alphaproteobacteria bacterium]|nr:sulfotransferase domain-containing protein [Alphaproteobacteria bacterium]